MRLTRELLIEADTPSLESLEKANFFRLADNRYLALPEDQSSLDAETVGSYSSSSFYSLLQGYVADQFTGKIVVDTGFGLKTLFFRNGSIVFASSRAIDDRLGEVLYRRGIINLDQLTEAAVQVTPDMKFGQVLVNKKILTSNDVWEALKQQVVHILRTIMIPSRVYLEVYSGGFELFTELYYMTHAKDLILSAHIYGHQVRSFVAGVENKSSVSINSQKCTLDSLHDGTFVKDFFEIVDEKTLISEIVSASKLSEVNTLATLMELFHRSYFKIDGEPFAKYPNCEIELPKLHQAIENYNGVVKEFKDLFEESGTQVPVNSILKFAEEVSNSCGHSLALDKSLRISSESIYRLTDYVIASGKQEETISAIQCLLQFKKLVAADHLPFEYYRQLKDFLTNVKEKAS